MKKEFSRDPQPLALPVRPQVEECFDSWIGRLATVHNVTVPELFDYLTIDTALAQIDLLPGRDGVGRELKASFDQMIERLTWAVSIDAHRVRRMFVKGDQSLMLPPALRRFVCPVCALARCRSGLPIVVEREWTLQVSWRCHEHRVPLVDLRRPERLGLPLGRWLERAGDVMTSFDAAQAYGDDLIDRNRKVLKQLLGPSYGTQSLLNAQYLAKFSRHKWHFASSRTLLLASAHCPESSFFGRYERIEAHLAELSKIPLPRPQSNVVTLPALREAIIKIQSQQVRRAPARLAALSKRLRAKPASVLMAQRWLNRVSAQLRIAWERQCRLRALGEGRKVQEAECEVMLGRITLECRENRSAGESLVYLRKAFAYREAVLLQNRGKFPDALVKPERWGLGFPNKNHMKAIIDDLERRLAAEGKSNA